jgi:hypothetical protein
MTFIKAVAMAVALSVAGLALPATAQAHDYRYYKPYHKNLVHAPQITIIVQQPRLKKKDIKKHKKLTKKRKKLLKKQEKFLKKHKPYYYSYDY